MHELDDVKRALLAADVRAVALRTQLPERVVMSLVEANGWDVAGAERVIDEAMQDVAKAMSEQIEKEIFYGGSPGGGKGCTMRTALDRFTAAVERPNGIIVSCVS